MRKRIHSGLEGIIPPLHLRRIGDAGQAKCCKSLGAGFDLDRAKPITADGQVNFGPAKITATPERLNQPLTMPDNQLPEQARPTATGFAYLSNSEKIRRQERRC